jgi:sugar phosphate isomerase/epimerase
MTGIKLACSTVVLPDIADVPEAFETVAQYGYDAVELRIAPDYHVAPDRVLSEAGRIRELAAQSGLEIAALAGYIPAADLAALEQLRDAAAALDCGRVRLGFFGYDPAVPYQDQLRRARSELAGVERLFRGSGVKALVELHFDTIHASASGMLRLLEGCDPAVIGMILDPANAIVEGRESWPMMFSALGPFLEHVHVRDASWQIGAQTGRWEYQWVPLGTGMVDWAGIVALCRASGFSGYLSNEDMLGVPRHLVASGDPGLRPLPERLGAAAFLRPLLSGA